MANVQHLNDIPPDRENNPVDIRRIAVEQLPHLKLQIYLFRSKWTSIRKFGERANRAYQGLEPWKSRFSSML